MATWLAFVQSEETSEGSHVVARVTEKASNAFMLYCTFSIFNFLNSSCRRDGGGKNPFLIISRSSGRVWEWCVYSRLSIFIVHLQTWFNLVTELEILPFVCTAWGTHFKTTTNETSGFFPWRHLTCEFMLKKINVLWKYRMALFGLFWLFRFCFLFLFFDLVNSLFKYRIRQMGICLFVCLAMPRVYCQCQCVRYCSSVFELSHQRFFSRVRSWVEASRRI